ncbi:Uncharacterised protein [Rikenella microfusus]|uniref:Uncharacterized protein n=1 Tax=Rikenella microfusus TaxID=28139 RepID=A0A379MW58_9BACT|nr:Uncharacterised protein [Rikenella microfusus]
MGNAENRAVNFMAGASGAKTSAAQLQAFAGDDSGPRDLKVAK